jgi:hypothetical protein
VIPASLSDSQLKKLMKETAISLSWRNPRSKASLVRLAKSKGDKKGGAKKGGVTLDEDIVATLRDASESERLSMVHCREAKAKEKGAADSSDAGAGGGATLLVSKATGKAFTKFLDICMAGKTSSSLTSYTKYVCALIKDILVNLNFLFCNFLDRIQSQ